MELNQKCEMIKTFLMKVYPTIKEVKVSNWCDDRKIMVVSLVSTDLDDEFNPTLAKLEICDKINSFFNTNITDQYFSYSDSDIVLGIKLV